MGNAEDEGRGLSIQEGIEPITIGDLFPADDLVAQWVFMLSAVVEDLAVADAQFRQAMKDDSNGQLTLHFRVLVSRIYEANRVLRFADSHDAIEPFVAQRPEAAREFKVLQGMYADDDGSRSRVDQLYALMRHRTVHHSFPGSAELTDALTGAADMEAFYVLDHDAETSHFVWPEMVAFQSLVGDMRDKAKQAAFQQQVMLAGKIVVAFTTMLRWVLEAHCARLGFDHEQLIRHRGTPPPVAAPPNRAARRAAARGRPRK